MELQNGMFVKEPEGTGKALSFVESGGLIQKLPNKQLFRLSDLRNTLDSSVQIESLLSSGPSRLLQLPSFAETCKDTCHNDNQTCHIAC